MAVLKQKINGQWVAIGTAQDGLQGNPGVGIVSIVKTATNGLVDTYTIALSNGNTTTFDVTNGQPGLPGANGVSIVGATITEV